MPRLFFALYPDDDIRRQIIPVSRSLPTQYGRLIAEKNWHITLVFLGQVSLQQQQALISRTDAIKSGSFSLCIEQSGWWKKPQILWLGPTLVPEQLLALVDKLKHIMQDCQLVAEERPYRPHLSLVRKARYAPEPVRFESISWNIKEFSLMESVSTNSGVHYQILKTWPLLS